MQWVNIPNASGFSYFNTYVNEANGYVLGWIARVTGSTGFGAVVGVGPYLVYYFDPTSLAGLVSETRPTPKFAKHTIHNAIAAKNVTVGLDQLDIPGITTQIINHQAIQKVRGW